MSINNFNYTRAALLMASLFVSAFGCTHTQPTDANEPMPVVVLEYDGMPAQTTLLAADYGMIIDWPDKDAPHFYLYDRTQRRRVRYDSLDVFIAAVKRLPDGVEVDWLEKCQAPFSWAMPEESLEKLLSVLESKRITMIGMDDPRHFTICTCESKGLVIQYDTVAEK